MISDPPLTSLEVCGTKTVTDSEWILIGGPIKGSYIGKGKNSQDLFFEYISDFGVYVEDPCQAVDNLMNINFDPSNKTVKDLRYHDGTESYFWLPTVC